MSVVFVDQLMRLEIGNIMGAKVVCGMHHVWWESGAQFDAAMALLNPVCPHCRLESANTLVCRSLDSGDGLALKRRRAIVRGTPRGSPPACPGRKPARAAGTRVAGSPGYRAKQQPGTAAAPGPIDLASLPNIKVACHNLTAQAIAENLHQMAGGYLDHDVMDSTKLEGSWDFDLEWTARAALSSKGSDGISVFDAVEKQLGLKLELKDVPSLVIESVHRKPTGNPTGVETALAVAAARFEAASIKPANPDQRVMAGLLYTGGSQMKAG